MYSPTSRLLTILEMLQSYKQMSGAEMARRLEVDVRTVRRYIVTLQDMGIPVEAERGPYGAYQLQRGYKLPPLMFNDAEAVALTLGLLAIREMQFPVNVAAVEGALAKTERVMPEKLLQQARALQEAIRFNITKPPVLRQNDFVVTLSSAVHQHQQVRLSYEAWNGQATERVFDPYGILFNDGYWYSAGYCHLRDGLRTFRLDRVVGLEMLDSSFDPPPEFDVLEHVLDSIATLPGAQQIEVMLQTTLEHAQQFLPRIMGTLEETEQGIIFRRAAIQLEWIAHVLIAMDCPMTIIQPPELRDLLRQIAAKALRIAGDEAAETT
jgi:predicted DNA-binding transcriptional regulator YafY